MKHAQMDSDVQAEVERVRLDEITHETGKTRKRNLSRRQVVNVSDDLALWLYTNADEVAGGSVQSTIRTLIAEALRARGVTPLDLKRAWHAHEISELEKAEQQAGSDQ